VKKSQKNDVNLVNPVKKMRKIVLFLVLNRGHFGFDLKNKANCPLAAGNTKH
jgi:hypothetical protein